MTTNSDRTVPAAPGLAGRVGGRHLPGPSSALLGHEDLLTLARKVQAAAADHDPERLGGATRRFVEALDRHLRAESTWLSRALPSETRILRRGQQRIRAVAEDLLVKADRGCPVPAAECGTRAENLMALLSLQARDEHQTLARPLD